jgi:hypothetical protein
MSVLPDFPQLKIDRGIFAVTASADFCASSFSLAAIRFLLSFQRFETPRTAGRHAWESKHRSKSYKDLREIMDARSPSPLDSVICFDETFDIARGDLDGRTRFMGRAKGYS